MYIMSIVLVIDVSFMKYFELNWGNFANRHTIQNPPPQKKKKNNNKINK